MNWKDGDDVIIVPAVSDEDAKEKFPERLERSEALPAPRAGPQGLSRPLDAVGPLGFRRHRRCPAATAAAHRPSARFGWLSAPDCGSVPPPGRPGPPDGISGSNDAQASIAVATAGSDSSSPNMLPAAGASPVESSAPPAVRHPPRRGGDLDTVLGQAVGVLGHRRPSAGATGSTAPPPTPPSGIRSAHASCAAAQRVRLPTGSGRTARTALAALAALGRLPALRHVGHLDAVLREARGERLHVGTAGGLIDRVVPQRSAPRTRTPPARSPPRRR